MINSDTIAAIATPPGNGGVGIIRVSGKKLISFAKKISNLSAIKIRYAHFCSFYNAANDIIDSGLLLYFKAPNSYTGEDVIEIQAHGGSLVLQLILHRCFELGARMAEAGEFTKRAFLNNKIDLIQAESVLDLINAESESAVKMASRSLQGNFSLFVEDLKTEIIALRTLIEGSLDFPEEDIDFIKEGNVLKKLLTISEKLKTLLKTAKQGSILREGVTLVLIGAPNVGKSSLLNLLAENEIAIVTNIAGTTRDVIREKILIEDVPLHIIDTAGLHNTKDIIENLGIKKSYESIKQADITLILIDPKEGINDETNAIINTLPNTINKLFIYNKIDLYPIEPHIEKINENNSAVYISVKNNLGIDFLKQEILNIVGYQPQNTESSFLARTRHVINLKQILSEIVLAIENIEFSDLMAEHLKNAQFYLNEITGEYSSDDLLGNIFSNFCIGK